MMETRRGGKGEWTREGKQKGMARLIRRRAEYGRRRMLFVTKSWRMIVRIEWAY